MGRARRFGDPPSSDVAAWTNEEGAPMERRVLVIDEDPSVREKLQTELSKRNLEVLALDVAKAIEALGTQTFGVVIADADSRASSGAPLHKELVPLLDDRPLVLMTAFQSITHAVAAIRDGAYDFVTKPMDFDDVALTIERAFERASLREEVKRLREESTVADPAHLLPMDEVEHRYIRQVLDAVRGNKAFAARVLGMDRRTLYRKLDRWREAGTNGTRPAGDTVATAT
jgi:DNA-binding NtrC family response regulator